MFSLSGLKSAEAQCDGLFSSGVHFQTGVVVGQNVPGKMCVVALCPTPIEDEDSCEDTPDARPPQTSFDADWATLHAQQVARFLPGGLSVLGMYVVGQPSGPWTATVQRTVSLLGTASTSPSLSLPPPLPLSSSSLFALLLN